MRAKPGYRMSSVGRCARALSAIRLGKDAGPEPVWLALAAEEGKWHEDRIVQLLNQDGFIVTGQQEELVLDYELFQIVGHIDGYVTEADLPRKLLEIKSMSQFEFDRWMRGKFEEFPHYADQLTCYMTASGLDNALYVVKNRSSGYVNRWFIEGIPSDFDTIYQKIYGIEVAAQAGQMIEADFDPLSLECKRCNFKHLCTEKAETLEPATVAQLEKAADLWRRGTALEKEGKELIAEGKDILESHAKTVRPEEKYSYPVAGLVVSRYFVKGGPVSFERKPSWNCRITDTEKEE